VQRRIFVVCSDLQRVVEVSRVRGRSRRYRECKSEGAAARSRSCSSALALTPVALHVTSAGLRAVRARNLGGPSAKNFGREVEGSLTVTLRNNGCKSEKKKGRD
jgi:hypothetical protein